jgi:hypothetical protein
MSKAADKKIVYHGDHLPKDASNVSYTWNWAEVTDKAALDKRAAGSATAVEATAVEGAPEVK